MVRKMNSAILIILTICKILKWLPITVLLQLMVLTKTFTQYQLNNFPLLKEDTLFIYCINKFRVRHLHIKDSSIMYFLDQGIKCIHYI